MNSRLLEMIERGRLPIRGGQWIDTYNQVTDAECAGTIIAGINAKNHYYVMVVDSLHPGQNGAVHSTDGIAPTICAGEGVKTQTKIAVPLNEYEDGISRTIKAQYQQTSKANLERQDALGATGVISIQQNTKEGAIQMELGGVADLSYPTSKTRRGRVQDGGTVTPALTCNTESCLRQIGTDYRIRKLTPRECFRLMGVSEPDIDTLLSAGISNSQLYKLAGNSIVVNCLAVIFRQLFIGNFNKKQQLEIF